MNITVVVPTYNESANLKALRLQRQQAPHVHWIVVDGGSTDDTLQACQQFSDWTVLSQNSGGRARQMNAGAKQASGDVLLFLHADTRLPEAWPQLVQAALSDSSVVGGAFVIRYQSKKIPDWVCHWLAFRSRHTRYPYGDQAIFVRRSIFETMGGFPDQPLMEDYEFSRRLWRYGSVKIISEPVVTSARRFEKGVLKTGLLMRLIWLLYNCGVSAERLAKWYK